MIPQEQNDNRAVRCSFTEFDESDCEKCVLHVSPNEKTKDQAWISLRDKYPSLSHYIGASSLLIISSLINIFMTNLILGCYFVAYLTHSL